MSIWLAVVAVAVLAAAYYALRLGFDLLVLVAMVIAGIVKLASKPFRHRRH